MHRYGSQQKQSPDYCFDSLHPVTKSLIDRVQDACNCHKRTKPLAVVKHKFFKGTGNSENKQKRNKRSQLLMITTLNT